MKCNAFSEELKNTYLFSIFKNSYFNISISKIIIYLKFKKKVKIFFTDFSSKLVNIVLNLFVIDICLSHSSGGLGWEGEKF